MSGLEQFVADYSESQDTLPELPSGTTAPRTYADASIQYDGQQASRQASPYPASPKRLSYLSTHSDDRAMRRRSRSVDVDFFDPAGVAELRSALSQISPQPSSSVDDDDDESFHADSDVTLASNGPFNLEKVIKEIARRLDEAGRKQRELGVMFKDLRVVGVGASAQYQETLGSILNPFSFFRFIQQLRHPSLRTILSDFEGALRPGEMLLVLGRPGAGCSTFLKVLANQRDEFHKVEGEMYYDSFTPEEIYKHYRGDVQYSPEDDVHFPTLTVEETLGFAAKTRTPRARLPGDTREEHVNRVVDVWTTVFGLRHVRKSIVGDAAIRGVSGGEKKRVSIGEALATLSRLNSWDNSTRGLDASTALEFVQALRIATDYARQSTAVAIYQAGESLYEHFDKVCLIYEGRMIYYGPADRARQYFIDMGYQPANRQTTADFLVAVTDPNGRIIRRGYRKRVPRTPDEFVKYFRKSEMMRINREDIESYKEEYVGKEQRMTDYKQSYLEDHAEHTNPKSPYIISVPMQVRALMLRRVQIIKGGYAIQIIQLGTFILQAIIMGTVFFQLKDETSTFYSRGGVLYFAILFAALTMMAEIPSLFAQRPIVLRQSRAAMYHPFVESLATTLVDAPKLAIIIIMFSIVLYFLVNLRQDAGAFFIFLLFVYSMTLIMQALFRAMAAASLSPAPAQLFGGLTVLVLTLYTGYSIPQPSMIGALKWITYINPLKYGFEALIVNEFHNLQGLCSSLIPSGSGYENITLANQACTTVGGTSGSNMVDGMRYVELSFDYAYDHLWRNFGIIWAFGIGFLFIYLVISEFNLHLAGESTTTIFKRGSKAPTAKVPTSSDPEKGRSRRTASNAQSKEESQKAVQDGALAMHDIFSWQHLNYTIPLGDGATRKLLDDVSGFVAPGKLTALVGSSGAGKTTLLNVLAERVSSGVVSGDRFVNGHPLPQDFQSQTGYCQQMDTHLPTATVREALLFSAKLRQPPSVPLAEKEAYVEKCLKMCGLEEYADAVVGSLGVEHRKRTTIGVELAAKPRLLLFLDEPTSGLDSQSAWAIVSFLRTLADSGQAILCTIHQPSAELFSVFDRLLLLRRGGQTVYFGDLGKDSHTLINYFQRNGGRECGPDENPAEYMLSVTGAGATAQSDTDWHEIWKNSPEARQLQEDLERIHSEGRSRPALEASHKGEFATSWGYQLYELLYRELQDHWRSPIYMMSKIGLNIFAGLLVGFTFFKAKDSIQGTQNKLFAIFMGTIASVGSANQLQVPFIATRSIYEIRERPSRIYSWTALISAQVLAEIPWNILSSSIFFLCWYWTVGFENSRGGYTFLMYSVMFPLYYTTIGQAVAAMSPNAEISAMLFGFFFSFVLTFNGVLQPFRQLGWWKWMYRVSPFTYLIEGLLGQAIGGTPVNCAPVEFASLEPPSGESCQSFLQTYIDNQGGYLSNPDATSGCLYCPFRTTDEYLLNTFNIEFSHHWRDLGIFIVFIAFNTVAIYVFTYIFRIQGANLRMWIQNRLARRK
ncbi:pleiotropic drug resistance ABC transporter [Panus rudis PR-1116 ss-1]|nr:pleiotropic drug resistance ABC transporter [Panus rudis PR-1116 ss-1]